MLIADWHPFECPKGSRMAFRARLHGRDIVVCVAHGSATWHWSVVSQGGHVLAEGDAPDRDSAARAAEDEVFAIHPPTPRLIDELIG